MRRLPWVKFSFDAWLRDPELRLCGLAARGLWIDMLGLMDADAERGYLTVNGATADEKQIARRLGLDWRTIKPLMKELVDNGVVSCDARGAIYCRRMVRDSPHGLLPVRWTPR